MTAKVGPVKEPSSTASGALAAVLLRGLLAGEYPPAARMPTERDMAAQHHVSRHVVREALKHLEALGLVEIQQGSGIYAKNVLLTGGMELFEYLLFDATGRFNAGALRDLLVFCRLFTPNVLRLAAQNRTFEDLDELRRALKERMQIGDDAKAMNAVNQRLMRTIAGATHNMLYQLIFNNIGRLLTRLRQVVPVEMFAPVISQSNLEHLIGAIEAGDAELAGLLAQRFSERAELSVGQFINALPDNSFIAMNNA